MKMDSLNEDQKYKRFRLQVLKVKELIIFLTFQQLTLIDMKAEVPNYRIKYIECEQRGHQGEKANIICLQDKCRGSSIICSLCCIGSHAGHRTKPIKFHIDEKLKTYKDSPLNYEECVQKLENQRDLLLTKLKFSVERIAAEFMQLQQDIMDKYELMRDQLMQVEHKRKKFQEFYLSMVKDHHGDPQFEIRDYLLEDKIEQFTQNDIVGTFANKACEQIRKISKSLVSNEIFIQKPQEIAKEVNIVKIPDNVFIAAPNLKRDLNTFTQTIGTANAASMCGFKQNLIDTTGRIRIKILTLPAGAKITFGTVLQTDLKSQNYVFKDANIAGYFDSLGKVKNGINNIGVMHAGDVIELFVKKNQLRVKSKNLKAQLNYFAYNSLVFVALEGLCSIEFLTTKK